MHTSVSYAHNTRIVRVASAPPLLQRNCVSFRSHSLRTFAHYCVCPGLQRFTPSHCCGDGRKPLSPGNTWPIRQHRTLPLAVGSLLNPPFTCNFRLAATLSQGESIYFHNIRLASTAAHRLTARCRLDTALARRCLLEEQSRIFSMAPVLPQLQQSCRP